MLCALSDVRGRLLDCEQWVLTSPNVTMTMSRSRHHHHRRPHHHHHHRWALQWHWKENNRDCWEYELKSKSAINSGMILIIGYFTAFPQKFLGLFVKISFITNPRTPTTNSRENSCWFWPPAQLRSQQHSNNYVGPRFERRACNRNYRIGNISLCIGLDSSLRDISK